jgi:HK97 family phage major capsid protein
LLDDAAFNIEDWLASKIADRFARAEAASFVNGDGLDKPTGFLATQLSPMIAGPGAIWVMLRPVWTVILHLPMQSSIWSMRWVRNTAPMRLLS